MRKSVSLLGTGFCQVALVLLSLALSCPGYAQSLNFDDVPPVTNGSATNSLAINAPVPNSPSANTSLGQPLADTSTLATKFPAINVPAPNSPPVSAIPDQPPADPVTLLLRQAFQLVQQKQFDAALDKVNAALQVAPKNSDAYGLRGNIYAQKGLWDQAWKDYHAALQFDGKNTKMRFNLAEIDFMQKKYDDARPGFLALEEDSDFGDLAAYKVFLCDLFGGHEELAAKELDAFNQVGSNASYYFANATWSLYHHKTEDGRGWLTSAVSIYALNKFKLYATSLVELGYLPLPPPSQKQ